MDNNQQGHDDQQSTTPFVSRQQYRQQQANQGADQEGRQPESERPNRKESLDQLHQANEDEKVNRLKRRLNIAIACLIVAIIVVYLILFYVG